MDMYRIVFSGELLDGFQMQDVRKAAAIRFRINDAQVASLFSGQLAVLKKAVSEEASRPYIAELARMGMRAHVEPIAHIDDASAVQLRFKVVFWGRTIAGYGRDQVMRAVPRRLRVDEAQVARLFSGAKAVLKRGVTAEVGARYVAELARIGMQVELEIETESLPANAVRSNVNFSQTNITGTNINPQTGEEFSYSGFMQTQIDFQRGAGLDTNIMGVVQQADAEPAPVAIPPKPPVAPPMSAAQKSERLASVIEAAYIAELGEDKPAAKLEMRCTQCGHRQASGTHCSACGCALPKKKKLIPAPAIDELTHSMRDELEGAYKPGGNLATLMREMRTQEPRDPQSERRRSLRTPMMVGGAACVLAVGGWLLLAH